MAGKATCEQIFNELLLLMQKNEVSEYDIIPLEPGVDSHFILCDDKLAINLAVVKSLYKYAHELTMKSKDVSATQVCLLLNPEFATIWNLRKNCIRSGTLKVSDDFKLMNLILTKFPKSATSFAHRKWVLENILKHNPDEILDILAIELQVVLRAADKYPNNYHAWSHRSWCLLSLVNDNKSYLLQEMQTINKFASSHISDYSSFYYLSFLLEQIFQKLSLEVFADQWLNCFDHLNGLMNFYEGHEALWCHRRALCSLMKLSKLMKVSNSENVWEHKAASTDHGIQLTQTMEDFVKKEEEWCKEHVDGRNDWEKRLGRQYLQWLHRNLDY